MDTDTEPGADGDGVGLPTLMPAISALHRWKQGFVELTYLSRQWQPADQGRSDPPLYSIWMASSEVDQKFLGYFAKVTTTENNYLSR
jgi:hypothetical protein